MNQSKRITLVAAGVLCAALAGCAALGGEKTYTDKKNGVEITFPKGWDIIESSDAALAIRNENPRSHVFVSVKLLPEDAGLRSFFENTNNKSLLSNHTLTDIRKCTLGGASALKLEASDSREDKRTTVYYVVARRRGYALWFHIAESDFDSYSKDIDAIVKSFTLLKYE